MVSIKKKLKLYSTRVFRSKTTILIKQNNNIIIPVVIYKLEATDKLQRCKEEISTGFK